MNTDFRPTINISPKDSFARLNQLHQPSGLSCCCGGLFAFILFVFLFGVVISSTDAQQQGKSGLYAILISGFIALIFLILQTPTMRKKRFYRKILQKILDGNLSVDDIAAQLNTDYEKVGLAIHDMIDTGVLPPENCDLVDNGHTVRFFVSDSEAARQRQEWDAMQNGNCDSPSEQPAFRFADICKGCGAINPDNKSHCEYCGSAFERIASHAKHTK